MKYFFDSLEEINRKISGAKPLVLMFDFDCTLAPLSKSPKRSAFLRADTKHLLNKVSRKFEVAIITGRSLDNIKERVDMAGLMYAGSHGMEWHVGKKPDSITMDRKSEKSLANIYKQFKKLKPKYPNLRVDDKKLCIGIGFKFIKKSLLDIFLAESDSIINKAINEGLDIIEEPTSFEFRPDIGWTKGEFAQYVIGHLKLKGSKQPLAIYVGDGITDEDAFRVLKNDITVRVEKDKNSAAQYYIENQKEINKFLKYILAL